MRTWRSSDMTPFAANKRHPRRIPGLHPALEDRELHRAAQFLLQPLGGPHGPLTAGADHHALRSISEESFHLPRIEFGQWTQHRAFDVHFFIFRRGPDIQEHRVADARRRDFAD